MNFDMFKRGIYVMGTEGPLVAFRKFRFFINVLLVKKFLLKGLDVNSQKYWETRLRFSWDSVGGGLQNQQFAVGMSQRVETAKLGMVNSILDYGCATGESVPVLSKMFPHARIYLFDLAREGMKQGLKKYRDTHRVSEWDAGTRVDLIYTSNVIEHVEDVNGFLSILYSQSKSAIIVQCPWDERHPDGSKLTPEKPQGEHIWTIDDSFIELNFDTFNWSWNKTLVNIPEAWPFGEQLILVGVKN
jgi:hypothetical protein